MSIKKLLFVIFLLIYFHISSCASAIQEKNKFKDIKAVLFDTFGTLVDWRKNILKEFQTSIQEKKITGVDFKTFALQWVSTYPENIKKINDQKIPFMTMDEFNFNSLEKMMNDYGISKYYTTYEVKYLSQSWHRLKPWPDVGFKTAFIQRPSEEEKVNLGEYDIVTSSIDSLAAIILK